MNRIDAFLEMAVKQGGSDVHMVSGQPLRIRLNGVLEPVRFRELSARDMDEFLEEFMTDGQRAVLAEHWHADFAYESEVAGRFRVNVYRHRDGLAAAFRVVPESPPALASLGLPVIMTACALQCARTKLYLGVFLGRLVRFTIEALLALYFGRQVLKFMKSPILDYVIYAFVIIGIVGSALSIMKWLHSRKKEDERDSGAPPQAEAKEA